MNLFTGLLPDLLVYLYYVCLLFTVSSIEMSGHVHMCGFGFKYEPYALTHIINEKLTEVS